MAYVELTVKDEVVSSFRIPDKIIDSFQLRREKMREDFRIAYEIIVQCSLASA